MFPLPSWLDCIFIRQLLIYSNIHPFKESTRLID